MVWGVDQATGVPARPANLPALGGLRYFSRPNAATGAKPTLVETDFLNMILDEMLGVLALQGTSPDKGNSFQLAAVIQALIAAEAASRHTEIVAAIANEASARSTEDNYLVNQLTNLFGAAGLQQDITNASLLLAAIDNEARRLGGANLAVVNASRVLDPNQLGLFLLDAGAGSITVTLPLASCFSGSNAVPRIRLIRVDGSANQVIIQCGGSSDNFSYSADSAGNPVRYTDILPAEALDVTGGLVSNQWYADRVRSRGRLRRFSGVVGTSLTPWSCLVPIGCRKADLWLGGGGGSGGSGDGTNPGGGGGAAGAVYKSLDVTPGTMIGGLLGFGAPAVTGGGVGDSGGTSNMTGTGLYATGGFGGKGGSSYPSNAGGLGGIGAGGDENVSGQSGGDGGAGFTASGYGGQPPSFLLGTGGRAAANGGGGETAADNAGTNGGGGGGSYGSNPGPGGHGGTGLAQVDFR